LCIDLFKGISLPTSTMWQLGILQEAKLNNASNRRHIVIGLLGCFS